MAPASVRRGFALDFAGSSIGSTSLLGRAPVEFQLHGGRSGLWEHSAPLGQYWYARLEREVNELAA